MKTNKKIGGNIFKSIMSSYIAICLIVLAGTMVGYIYNYKVIDSNIASLAQQRAVITAANLDKEFEQYLSALSSTSTDKRFTRTLDMTSAEIGREVVVLSDLKDVLVDNMDRGTIKDAHIYYFDTDSMMSLYSRYWDSSVVDFYIDSIGLSKDEFMEKVNFTGINQGKIFEDGRIWIMQNVYDNHYRKKAVIVVEGMMSDIDVGEAKESVTVLTDCAEMVYVSDPARKNLSEDVLSADNIRINKDSYYYVRAELSTMPWYCYVGAPRTSLYKEIRIFWFIFVLEIIGALILILFLSFKSTSRLWKPMQELLDAIQAQEDVGFMETFKGVNDKVSRIVSENSMMQKNVTKLEPYMYESRIRRVLDGDISNEDSVIKTFSDFIGIEEGQPWSVILVRPQSVKQGELINKKGAIGVDNTDKDIMSFTLKNIIDELTETDTSRVYKYGNEYLLFSAVKDTDEEVLFKEKLDEMRKFYEETLREPIYILIGEVYRSFSSVREIYLALQSELEYRIFWNDKVVPESVWVMRGEQSEEQMVEFDQYTDTVKMMLNCLETGNFKEAYQMLDTYLDKAFPHNKRYLRQNNYRMYGLASILTMTISHRMENEDKEFLEKLNYEERLMDVSNMEELRESCKDIFSAIIDYMESKEKDGIPAWMDDVQVYIHEHYTEQGFSVSGIADEYGFTVSHLSRTFKSVVGTGLLEYIQKLRVEKAKELLEGGASVNDAAVGSGYLDAKALTRAFKKYEGITPGSYRDSKK
jgi:AraC-like DNA-binding protein